MNERWEKGIVVGISNECYYVASRNEEYFLRKNSTEHSFKIGDCMDFTFGIVDTSNGQTHRGIVLKHERCAQFVEWKLLRTKNAAILKSDIIEVTVENHPYSKRPVRCVRTKFLEKVYDSDVDVDRKTHGLTDSDLLNMKAVAIRVTNAEKKYFWAILGCERKLNESLQNFTSDRNMLEGIVLKLPTKPGYDTIYVWVPGRRRSLVLSPSARGNQPREKFLGNWISFSVSPGVCEIDANSNIQIIDDILPTRFHSNSFEVRVDVSFEYNCDRRIRVPELKSRDCGIVVDTSGTLERYNRLRNFADRAWVYTFPYDLSRDIRFVLSEKQNEWDRFDERDYEYSGFGTSREPRNQFYDENLNEQRRATPNSDVDSWDREDDLESRKEKTGFFNREKSRYDNSDLRKRDDSNSIPSTSRSFEESQSIRNNLTKLKKKYDYLTENDMEIPEKLIEELKKARIEEQNSAKIKNFNYDDFDENHSRISEIRKQRELAKIEIDGEELRKYKKLVTLFRDMMSSEKVCDEMRKFDERSMKNINRLIFEL
ncbi:unnamed protein product [Caenorhabditis angaria]|uniref:Uncharacterized protein n=1 Tax=Caenorhabditis angaria TaxID=860376 RepID=A0A9P1IR47_9PELO|nr:unnamed protein product [Caenorhabditis angaria]